LTPNRINYLDWLKVLIVYGIVVFHVCVVFAVGGWLVNNAQRSLVLSAFAGFCFPWGIPAMFMIAGADAWFGLRNHSASAFILSRARRLLVPMVLGMILLSPLQRFVVSHNPPPGLEHLVAFYVAFYRGVQFNFTMQWLATYSLHLWFLGYLFAISVAVLPILHWLRSPGGKRFTELAVSVANRRAGLFLLAAPLCLSQLLLRPFFADYQDWADVATYTIVFLWGAVMFGDRRFETVIRREIRWILAVGLIVVPGLAAIALTSPSRMLHADQEREALTAAYAILLSLDVWSWLLAVLYLGMRWFDFSNPALTYARESVLPIYVLHHPILLTVASFAVTWNLAVWPKFGLTLILVFGLTLALYEFGVRRWMVTRVVFGLGRGVPGTRLTAPVGG